MSNHEQFDDYNFDDYEQAQEVATPELKDEDTRYYGYRPGFIGGYQDYEE